MNEYSYQKIFEYTNIFISNNCTNKYITIQFKAVFYLSQLKMQLAKKGKFSLHQIECENSVCFWTSYRLAFLVVTHELFLQFMCKSSKHKYIRILKTIRTNIRIYSYQKNDTNEYTNIFVSKKSIRTNIRIYSYQKNDTNMIRTNIRIGKYSNIFEYPNIRHTMISTFAPGKRACARYEETGRHGRHRFQTDFFLGLVRDLRRPR